MALISADRPACALCWEEMPADDSSQSWELEDGQVIVICAHCARVLQGRMDALADAWATGY